MQQNECTKNSQKRASVNKLYKAIMPTLIHDLLVYSKL